MSARTPQYSCPEDAGGERSLFEFPREVQSLVGPFDEPLGVSRSGEIVCDLHSEEFNHLHPFHCVTSDGKWHMALL